MKSQVAFLTCQLQSVAHTVYSSAQQLWWDVLLETEQVLMLMTYEHIFGALFSVFVFLKKKPNRLKTCTYYQEMWVRISTVCANFMQFFVLLHYIPVSCISTQMDQTCCWIQLCKGQRPLEPQFLLLQN